MTEAPLWNHDGDPQPAFDIPQRLLTFWLNLSVVDITPQDYQRFGEQAARNLNIPDLFRPGESMRDMIERILNFLIMDVDHFVPFFLGDYPEPSTPVDIVPSELLPHDLEQKVKNRALMDFLKIEQDVDPEMRVCHEMAEPQINAFIRLMLDIDEVGEPGEDEVVNEGYEPSQFKGIQEPSWLRRGLALSQLGIYNQGIPLPIHFPHDANIYLALELGNLEKPPQQPDLDKESTQQKSKGKPQSIYFCALGQRSTQLMDVLYSPDYRHMLRFMVADGSYNMTRQLLNLLTEFFKQLSYYKFREVHAYFEDASSAVQQKVYHLLASHTHKHGPLNVLLMESHYKDDQGGKTKYIRDKWLEFSWNEREGLLQVTLEGPEPGSTKKTFLLRPGKLQASQEFDFYEWNEGELVEENWRPYPTEGYEDAYRFFEWLNAVRLRDYHNVTAEILKQQKLEEDILASHDIVAALEHINGVVQDVIIDDERIAPKRPRDMIYHSLACRYQYFPQVNNTHIKRTVTSQNYIKQRHARYPERN